MKMTDIIAFRKRLIKCFSNDFIKIGMSGLQFDIKIIGKNKEFYEILFFDGVLDVSNNESKTIKKRYHRSKNKIVFFDKNFEILENIIKYLESDRVDFFKSEKEIVLTSFDSKSIVFDGLNMAIDHVSVLLKSVSINHFKKESVETLITSYISNSFLIDEVVTPFYGSSIKASDYLFLFGVDGCQYSYFEKNFDKTSAFVEIVDDSAFLIEDQNGWYIDINSGYRYYDDKYLYINDITTNKIVPNDSEEFSGFIFKPSADGDNNNYEKYITVLKPDVDLEKEPRKRYFSANKMVFKLKQNKNNKYSLCLLDGQEVPFFHPDIRLKIIPEPSGIS